MRRVTKLPAFAANSYEASADVSLSAEPCISSIGIFSLAARCKAPRPLAYILVYNLAEILSCTNGSDAYLLTIAGSRERAAWSNPLASVKDGTTLFKSLANIT